MAAVAMTRGKCEADNAVGRIGRAGIGGAGGQRADADVVYPSVDRAT